MPASTIPIALCAANARYGHPSLGLRYLQAALTDTRFEGHLFEFTLTDRPADMAEAILSSNPQAVLLSVHIWSLPLLTELASILKRIRPTLPLLAGGPELICPSDLPALSDLVDHSIAGEADLALPALLERLFEGTLEPMVVLPLPRLDQVRLPYDLYTDDDIAHRTIYVETTRGCPHGCEFCLSSRDPELRRFDQSRVTAALARLIERGCRQFKFIDRTLHDKDAIALLDFFSRTSPDPVFLHFEVIPDRLSDAMFFALAAFDKGHIQLEAGVQTFDDTVAARIGRRQDMEKTERNLQRLRQETPVHIHADLVAGLPGEDMAGFGAGFNRLLGTGVHEIQVGILKRLRGAPIDRHTAPFQMTYKETPPYDILETNAVSFADMQRLKRFARYFDLVHNSGNFPMAASRLLAADDPFSAFMAFADQTYAAFRRTDAIALDALCNHLFEWLTERNGLCAGEAANLLLADYLRAGRGRFPSCIREFATVPIPAYAPASGHRHLPTRQGRRHKGQPE